MAFNALAYRGIPVLAIGKYKPVSSGVNDSFSELVLNFKKGEQNAINYFEQETRQLFMSRQLDKDPFFVATIPSSTTNKAHKGFPTFFSKLALSFPIENPKSNILYRVESKQPAHLGGDRSVQANELTMAVHQSHGDLKGKNIILLDDVLTTGNSVKAGINILLKKGATVKLAIVMGRTV